MTPKVAYEHEPDLRLRLWASINTRRLASHWAEPRRHGQAAEDARSETTDLVSERARIRAILRRRAQRRCARSSGSVPTGAQS